MAHSERDEAPMLLGTYSHIDRQRESQIPSFNSWTRSASISIPMTFNDSIRIENPLVGRTGPLRSERKIPSIQLSGPLYISRNHENLFQPDQNATEQKATELTLKNYPVFSESNPTDWPHNDYVAKNEHLLRSGQLGMCNDPYCTTCPTYYKDNGQQTNAKASLPFGHKFHNVYYGGTKRWDKRFSSFLRIPGIMNPHTKVVQQWNQFFVFSCFLAIFIDPLFFFVLSVNENSKCIVISQTMSTTLVIFRSLSDFIYLLHILLQFRLAFVAPESRVVGAGDLVDDPRKIALNYLYGYFLVDLFVVLPLPQIIILLVLPKFMGSSLANTAKNFLRAAVLCQYIPRLYRFLPLLSGQSPTGFIFESAWANFIINLLTFMLSGHVVGSCWYLLGLQRVNQCLRNACNDTKITDCPIFIDCGHGSNSFEAFSAWNSWKTNENANSCFSKDGDFSYGIYAQAVNLSTERDPFTRYVYSLFWGFQQISTLAGNQVPSYFVWEVLFTMGIIGMGLLLFALLIGNMQNFLQSLGRRRLEMSLRRRDFEQWMSHRRLPEELRRQIRESERYSWAASRGVNEDMLLYDLPEDLQREIRRHLFKFVKKVQIFSLMDEPVLDSIRERLRQKTYIKGSKVLCPACHIDKMVFLVRGRMESIGEDGNSVLTEGDVCGEELLTWFLEHSYVSKDERKIKNVGHRLLSNRMVQCVTNVEAFVLKAEDLEEVTNLFSRSLRNPRVQGAIRYKSHYWRCLAAIRIQVAWRYRKKRLTRANSSQSSNSNYSN